MRNLFFFFILTIIVSHAAQAGVSKKEREVLLELYHSTAGTEWRIVWELSEPVSRWHGVGIENGRVVSLELSDNNLNGTLPDAIGELKYLRKLDLSYNSVKGRIPKGVFNLRRLIVLNLQENNLTGQIPLLGRFGKLAILNISNNDLSGKLPRSLGRAKKIQRFSLSNNNFKGPVPRAIGKMESLMHLEIEGNHLTGDLPRALGDLKNLRTVLLKGNALSGKIPLALLTLPKLIRFEMEERGTGRYDIIDYGYGEPDMTARDNDEVDLLKDGFYRRSWLIRKTDIQRTLF